MNEKKLTIHYSVYPADNVLLMLIQYVIDVPLPVELKEVLLSGRRSWAVESNTVINHGVDSKTPYNPTCYDFLFLPSDAQLR